MVHQLTFGTLMELDQDLIEIVVNNGIAMGAKEAIELREIVDTKIARPVGLIVNRKNKYSHTFESLNERGSGFIKAVAIVVYSEVSEKAVRIHKMLHDQKHRRHEMFRSKASAREWLREQLKLRDLETYYLLRQSNGLEF